MQPGGISRVAVTAVQSSIYTPYTATLNVTLNSQYVLAIPVEGDFDGQNTSPVVRDPQIAMLPIYLLIEYVIALSLIVIHSQ